MYQPTDVYQNTRKKAGIQDLTVARALVAELIRGYEVVGIGCTSLEVQKLGWFLHRWIDAESVDNPLRLEFGANKYGPYSDQLRHLLHAMDGSYLHCERRLADAGPRDLIRFDDERRQEVAKYLAEPWSRLYETPLKKTTELIDGFESPLGMELLATVDWLISRERCEVTVGSLREGLAQWPASRAAARRKQRLFDDKMLSIALVRLTECGLIEPGGAR